MRNENDIVRNQAEIQVHVDSARRSDGVTRFVIHFLDGEQFIIEPCQIDRSKLYIYCPSLGRMHCVWLGVKDGKMELINPLDLI